MTDAPHAALSIYPAAAARGGELFHEVADRFDRELQAFAERRLAVAT